jgi:hypothetical protein
MIEAVLPSLILHYSEGWDGLVARVQATASRSPVIGIYVDLLNG